MPIQTQKHAVNDIGTALDRLELQYPNEEVGVWAIRNSTDKWHPTNYYAAYVGSAKDGNRVYANSEASPLTAVIQLIADAGERDPEQMLQARMAELKAELACLQAQAAKTEFGPDLYGRTPMEATSHGSAETPLQ